MTKEEILRQVADIIADVGGLPVDEITPEKYFADDLDIDSLGLVEIGANIEDNLGVEIPDDKLAELTTVGAVVDYLAGSAQPISAG
ncbi:acyl carrier protein [Amycolatopsis albispora]|uniref:Acyl carrier protein n=1 Tax=Amycolatopsis albispora TaxID=1804986 RepID=A0A344LK60_9PSEU|nr:acyl carrier protein [Amycolatopsis albispora]AXB48434.1 acyl carrier protein [Amycolatopsis albispora]